MRTIAKLLFLFLGACAMFPAYSAALTTFESGPPAVSYLPQSRNSITGFVFNESRAPVPRVYVELLNDVYSTIARVQTNGSGMYTFNGLGTGQYNVRVMTAGTDFLEQTRSISLVPLSMAGRGSVTEQVDFYLRRRNTGDTPAAVPGVVFIQEVPDRAKELYESGINDLDAKNESAGFDKLKKSLEAFPDYYLALDRLGNEYVNRGYYEPAFILLTKAVEVNPRSFTSTFGLGIAEFRLGQQGRAAELFERSTELMKNSANAHLWLGIALHSKSQYDKALAAILRADELTSGGSSEVHWQLARVYKDLGRYKKSADELDLYLKLSPNAPNTEEIKKVIAALRNKQ